jgi:hypothetical protein
MYNMNGGKTAGAHAEGGVVAYFKVCGTCGWKYCQNREKKKLGLGNQCLGSDFYMRHPEKKEIWPHYKF